MVTLYRSNYDEFNPDNNGGDITNTLIESGVLHSFIPRVRARTAEIGGERWFKFFVKTDSNIITIGCDIAKYTDSPSEEIYFTFETKDDHSDVESDLDKDNMRFYGGFKIIDIDIDNKTITADRDVSDFIKSDDNVTFYDDDINRLTAMIVESVDTDKITFKKWSDITLNIGNYGSSSIYKSFLNANEYFGIWIKQVINSYTEAMENPADNFNFNCWYDLK